MARILVCDDEDAMRAFVARALQLDGHSTREAIDGAHALELIEEEGGAFDLVVSDIRMPAMDGIALALSLARDYPAIRILLMTGFADQRERASNLEAIIFDVVTKPFALATIREKANAALMAA